MQDLSGRVAVVTGAASGIGRALATRLAEEGMRVALADVEGLALEAARRALAEAGHDVIGVVADVGLADAVDALAERVVEAFGGVHVVCNNAGVFAGGLSWEAPLSDYEWVLRVNTWGVIHGIRSFVPRMLAQDEPGHVVNTASMAALTSAPLSGAYYMSKHAVLALSETLHHELALQQAKIGVSVVCPELIRTGIGHSDRNRPSHLKRDDDPAPAAQAVEGALRQFAETGFDPGVIAARVVDAIRADRFYVLCEPGGNWSAACDARLEDIRLRRNPTFAVPATGN